MEERRRSTGERAQQSAQASSGSRPKKSRKKRSAVKNVFFWIGTLVLIGILTAAMFVGIFMTYVNKSLKGHEEVDITAYNASVSSELYYRDPQTGEEVMYDTLFLNAENRIWVTLDEIPKDLQDAAIAIEDKRFESHHGVDWKRTIGAIVYTLTGHDVQGGSSITQQMLKNATGDNQNTVRRKVVEIYRALAFEKTHSKDEIMENYLNRIYMGESCFGVKTAAKMYFGKEVSELSLAECASLIAITNNPSMYDPLIDDWTREMNRGRQTDVLDAMLDQGKISEAQYNAAMNEEIVFSDGYTCFGNYVDPDPSDEPDDTGEGEDTDTVTRARNSYFTDQVIDDVIAALQDKYGYDYMTAENKVFGGCKIFTTQNIDLQHICEEVFENTEYVDILDSEGEPLQAAITLMDPYTGEVLAVVGGTGVKTINRGWNWATTTRQCGSAIKPISTYAPALDDGTITAGSSIDDYPVMELNGHAYPQNSHAGFGGLTSVQNAIINSLNTCAARVNLKYGTYSSYNFMVDKLGFTTLTEDDAEKVGAMALGGLQYGVNTKEMAAAYAIFVNDGLYTKPYTFYRVEDADGNVLLENSPQSSVAIKESTAYLMREMLRSVITSGTGYEAAFSGMSQGGKTGTTNDERDRYFVGFTPYYCAAVWTGFRSNEQIWIGGNPAANLWREVMSRVHANLSDPGFHSATGVTTVTVCADSGLLATDACTHDLRGNRARTVTVAADTAPTQRCNMHKTVKWCKDGKHIATEFCPEESVEEVAVLDYDREIIGGIKASDHQYLLKVLSADKVDDQDNKFCPVHNEEWKKKKDEEDKKKEEEANKPKPGEPATPEDPVDPMNPEDPATPVNPEDPDNPDDPGDTGGGE